MLAKNVFKLDQNEWKAPVVFKRERRNTALLSKTPQAETGHEKRLQSHTPYERL